MVSKEVEDLGKKTMNPSEYYELIQGLVKEFSENPSIRFSGWANTSSFDTFKNGQYLQQVVLNDRGSSNVTPMGNYHEKENTPMDFRLSISYQVNKEHRVSFWVSKTVAGGMVSYSSIKLKFGEQELNKIRIRNYVKGILID